MVGKIFKFTGKNMTQTKTRQLTIAMKMKQWSAWQTKPKNTLRSTKYNQNNGGTMLLRHHHENCSGEPRVMEMVPFK